MLFRLAYNAVFDDWRADPAVRLEKVRTARIAGHGRIPALVDGERIRLGRLVNVRFEPRAFTAVVPA
jgi:diacylglycerol kinase family enzyme